MRLSSLAARNLWRNPRRTALSTGSVIAGVAVLIIGRGFLSGFTENIIRAQADGMSGHLLLRPVDYPTIGLDHPIDGLFTVDAPLRSTLDAMGPNTSRVIFAPLVTHATDSVRARAIAFDPRTDDLVFPKASWGLTGALPATASDGVAISRGLATLLDLDVGDRVVLQSRTPAGAMNALSAPVSGLYAAGNGLLDGLGLLLTRDLAEQLLTTDGASSHVAVRLARRDQSERLAEDLRAVAPPNVEVRTWQQETADLRRLQSIRQRALDLIVLALLAMSATGIANTILMAAYERIREVGTLQALGMTRSRVVALFLNEGAMIGLLGAAIGSAIGTSVVAYYEVNGLDLSFAARGGAAGNLPFSTMLYLKVDPVTVALAVVFGVLVATLASIYPAYVASRMAPADAVRG